MKVFRGYTRVPRSLSGPYLDDIGMILSRRPSKFIISRMVQIFSCWPGLVLNFKTTVWVPLADISMEQAHSILAAVDDDLRDCTIKCVARYLGQLFRTRFT